VLFGESIEACVSGLRPEVAGLCRGAIRALGDGHGEEEVGPVGVEGYGVAGAFWNLLNHDTQVPIFAEGWFGMPEFL